MNIENLLKIAEHVKTIPAELFDISIFREKYHNNPEIDLIKKGFCGCAIGHSVRYFEIEKEKYRREEFEDGELYTWFDYEKWAKDITGLNIAEYDWCFSGYWHSVDNTTEGVVQRINWLIEKGLPENYHNQIKGVTPLCYK